MELTPIMENDAMTSQTEQTSETTDLLDSPETVLPNGQGGLAPCPSLLTEEELIRFLRIPEISKAADHRNVIENLKRMHNLPCIHICKRSLYPLEAIRQWTLEKVRKEQR